MCVRYNVLSESDLLQLPVGELCAADALVVVWMTNKLKQQHFVRDSLFPHWNVTFLAEWYWLKVLQCVALIVIKITVVSITAETLMGTKCCCYCC